MAYTETKITNEQMDRIIAKIMALPGITTDHDSYFIAEGNGDDTTYIKFMSDKGVTDDANGKELGRFLEANGAHIKQNRDRALKVDDADLIRLFV